MAPPGPVKIGHKKDGRQRRPHRFHVSRSRPYPAAGSATGTCLQFSRVLFAGSTVSDLGIRTKIRQSRYEHRVQRVL